MDQNTVIQRLVSERKKQKRSVASIAREIKVQNVTIYRLEEGVTTNPRYDLIESYAKALGFSLVLIVSDHYLQTN